MDSGVSASASEYIAVRQDQKSSTMGAPPGEPGSAPKPPVPPFTSGSEVVETSLWLSLLRSCSGFEPFMKRHQGRVTGRAVAAFLLLERSFPRSVRYSVSEARARLEAIRPPSHHDLPGGRALLRLGALDAWLHEMTPETLDPSHDLATRIVNDVADVCAEIGRELLGYQVS